MTKIKKLLAVYFIFLVILPITFTCCKTNNSYTHGKLDEKITEEAVLIKHPERMFWEIQRGEASIYIVGTIHFADKDFYPLEDKVIRSFDKADVLVSELGGLTEMLSVQQKLQSKMLKSINLEPKKDLSNFLSEEEINIIKEELGKTEAISLFKFNPWILTMSLNQMLYTKAGLGPENSIDMYLINHAGERPIEALESIDYQLDLISSGSFEEQLKELKKTLKDLQDDEKTVDLLIRIKKLYLENNDKELTDFIDSLLDINDGISQDEFLKNRNIIWADKFAEYLDKGGKTFVFAGLAHFLGNDSVFEQMRKKGALK